MKKKSGIKLFSLINIEIKVPDPKAYCAYLEKKSEEQSYFICILSAHSILHA
jgi:hypothetical protein